MDLCDIRVIRAVLGRHQFHFSKALGQNFLTASWVAEKIAEVSGLTDAHGVLEVGPGFGALTQQLCLRAGHVLALELDRRLPAVLAETMGSFPNLTVVQGDICRADLGLLVREHLSGFTPAAVANLPYSVTTPAITALLEAGIFSSVTVMVQREVARRITAPAGTADYGSFSVYCQVKMRPVIAFDVPPDCFTPQPKVHSCVVRMVPHEKPPVPEEEQARFFKVTRAAFAQRRKTLCNALSAVFPQPKEELASVIRRCGLDPQIRGEMLDISAFSALARELYLSERM